MIKRHPKRVLKSFPIRTGLLNPVSQINRLKVSENVQPGQFSCLEKDGKRDSPVDTPGRGRLEAWAETCRERSGIGIVEVVAIKTG